MIQPQVSNFSVRQYLTFCYYNNQSRSKFRAAAIIFLTLSETIAATRLMALPPGQCIAITSISTSTFLGKSLTATAERAGYGAVKFDP